MGNTLDKPQLQETELNPPPESQTDDAIFTCEICIEPVTSRTKKFRNKNLCTHPFCVDCMIRYIEVKLEENVSQIPCPALHCSNMFDPVSLQPLLSPTVFTKWCDLLCDSTLLGVDRCYCPNRDCSASVINECGGDVKKSKCPNCKRWFCFKCRVAWHAGFGCEEGGEMRDANEVAFGVLAERKKWKRCPRCRHYVARAAGCNFIKCRCGSAFCYNCGKHFGAGQHVCDREHRQRSNVGLKTVALTVFVGLFMYFAILGLCLVIKHGQKSLAP